MTRWTLPLPLPSSSTSSPTLPTLPELATAPSLLYHPISPPASSPHCDRRTFPAPPAPSSQPLERTTSGHKRGRGWFASTTMASGLYKPTGEGDVDQQSETEGRGGAGGLLAMGWDTMATYSEEFSTRMGGKYDPEEGDDEEEEERPRKRGFVGTAGSLLSSTADVLIFGSALAYSGYQLWRKPTSSSNSDVDQLLTARLHPPTTPDAPPPYVPHHSSPSQIPRRIRHAHPPLPRPSHRRSSLPYPTPPIEPNQFDTFFRPLTSPPLPLPEFVPLEEGIESEDEDDEMKAMAARMQALIESGRAALRTQPTWDAPAPPWGAPRSAPMPSIKRFEDSSASSTGSRPAWGGGRMASPGHARRQTVGVLPVGLSEGGSVVIPFGGNRERHHASRRSLDAVLSGNGVRGVRE